MNANPKIPEIPGFEIIEMLGEGAMARVYLAVDKALDRKVAMKVMNRSLAHDSSFRDRFLAEAKDTAKFDHAGIVSIHSMGVVDDNYYLVLEYLEDGTLKDHIRSKQQEFAESGIPPEQLFSAQEAVLLSTPVEEAASGFIQTALQRGASDNVTVVIVECCDSAQQLPDDDDATVLYPSGGMV